MLFLSQDLVILVPSYKKWRIWYRNKTRLLRKNIFGLWTVMFSHCSVIEYWNIVANNFIVLNTNGKPISAACTVRSNSFNQRDQLPKMISDGNNLKILSLHQCNSAAVDYSTIQLSKLIFPNADAGGTVHWIANFASTMPLDYYSSCRGKSYSQS